MSHARNAINKTKRNCKVNLDAKLDLEKQNLILSLQEYFYNFNRSTRISIKNRNILSFIQTRLIFKKAYADVRLIAIWASDKFFNLCL